MEVLVLKKLLKKLFFVFNLSRDRPHFKQHIYQGIEAMELPKKHFNPIFDATVSLIDAGKVPKIIKNFLSLSRNRSEGN